MTQRFFTKRRLCRHCRRGFTIASSNHWYCCNLVCKRERRKIDRDARKARLAQAQDGSAGHLARAVKSGE